MELDAPVALACAAMYLMVDVPEGLQQRAGAAAFRHPQGPRAQCLGVHDLSRSACTIATLLIDQNIHCAPCQAHPLRCQARLVERARSTSDVKPMCPHNAIPCMTLVTQGLWHCLYDLSGSVQNPALPGFGAMQEGAQPTHEQHGAVLLRGGAEEGACGRRHGHAQVCPAAVAAVHENLQRLAGHA